LLLGAYVAMTSAAWTLGFVNHSRFVAEGPPTLDVILNGLSLGAWAVVGAVLIYRQPHNVIGWLFASSPLLIGLDQFMWGYVYFGTITRPGALPGVEVLMFWQHWHGVVFALLPVAFLFLSFPTGRPLSPRWGRVWWVMVGALVVYVLAAAISPLTVLSVSVPFFTDGVAGTFGLDSAFRAALQPVTWAAYLTMILCTLISAASLLVRLFRATGVERQQIKWFAFAASLAIPGFTLLVTGLVLGGARGDRIFASGLWLVIGTVAGIAVASAIAIFRYRLYDIDLIIRRTLVYSALTALLAGAYFGSVLVFQGAFRLVTGGTQGALVTVLSTLAIAALFVPLRRRLQDSVDRRFFRRKYDAARTLAGFGTGLRDCVDVDDLQARLLSVVDETLHPAHARLWLRQPGRPSAPDSPGQPR
jgi:hypothetical protein